MKLKIISDGTKPGTQLVNAETGETVGDIMRVEWCMDAKEGMSAAVIRCELVQADLVFDDMVVRDEAALNTTSFASPGSQS